MNGYYIDPMIFYWMYVFESLNYVCIVVFAMSCLVMLALPILAYTEFLVPDFEPEDLFKYKIGIALVVFTFTISLAGTIFIPNKQTCEEMFVASCITRDNVKEAKGEIKDIVDYVSKKIEEADKE